MTWNITVRRNRRTLRKAKILAAKRNASISGLAEQIEALVGEDDAYEQAQRRALALVEEGYTWAAGRIHARRVARLGGWNRLASWLREAERYSAAA